MRIVSFLLVVFFVSVQTFAQSPHKESIKGMDCSSCHEATTWKVIPDKISFNHDNTDFKLIGGHKTVDCKSCHTSLVFSQAKTSCFQCHKDIHQGTVGLDCARCHTPKTWIVQNISEVHSMSRFPLVGAHRALDCAQCHAGYSKLDFSPQGVTCFDCHKQQYYSTTAPNHVQSGFSTNCEQCHSISSFEWASANFQHDFFPLVGGHKLNSCFSCHTQGSNFKGLSTDCYSCHKKDYDATTDPNHLKAGFSTDCSSCHNINTFLNAKFDHNTTQFPLTGRHVNVSCSSCHTSGYTNTSTDCYSCHQKDYNGAKDPNHLSQNFPHDCSQCHSTSGWDGAKFDHSTTSFPLTGQHASVSCNSCHSSGYNNTSADCYSCHQKDYNGAKDPNHLSQNFPHDCSQCHSTSGWDGAKFDHSTTSFPLTGQHVSVSCNSCHSSGYTNTPTDCYSCHKNDYNNTKDPNHLSQNFPHDCSQCHSTSGWDGAKFDHATTGFPLTGQHAVATCTACHSTGYTNTSPDCFSCHANSFNGTTNPNHASIGISHDCVQCHNSTAWIPSSFSHNNTAFPLTGQHVSTDCASCHKGSTTNVSTDCYSCHQNDYNNAKDPNHLAQNFPHDCSQCHSTNGWDGASFDHSTTGFPLTGQHVSVSCSSCHSSGYNNTSPDCYSCHQNNYNNAKDPNHLAQNYPHDCSQCHSTNGWDGAKFDHATTGFPLTGQHVSVSCNSCHSSGYTNTPADCYSCHQTDYNNTKDPNHAAQNFAHDCSQCHSTSGWDGASFDHATTGFALTGGHASVSCQSCHSTGYTNTSTDCYSCHASSFVNTTNPNHTTIGISHDCKQCHNSNAWIPSSFNHSNTAFPLTGQHINTDCASCHKGTTTNVNTDCYSCHQNDYNNAKDPDHMAQSFPHDCSQCHSTSGWDGADFDHATTGFPLTGAHSTTTCASCHQSGYAGTSTQCYSCHQSNFTNASNPSHTKLGLSTDCSTCHTTDPGWNPAQFPNHDTYFQFQGAHVNIKNNCASCHNGNYNTTPNTCYGCHKSNYDGTTNPNHQAAAFPTDCVSCHSQSAWTPATFDHDSKYFPIYSGNHRGTWSTCATCHTSSTNFTVFTCLTCHEHSQSRMDSKHSGNKNYSYVSSECYRCHPNGRGG